MKDLLQKVGAGDPVSARQHNILVELVRAFVGAGPRGFIGADVAVRRASGGCPIQWFHTLEHWTYDSDENGCSISCSPASDKDDEESNDGEYTVWLPRNGSSEDPNVEDGETLLAVLDQNDEWVAVSDVLDGVVYRSIRIFYGGESDVPRGWHLCDGSAIPDTSPTVNLPDLRQRFVAGFAPDGPCSLVDNLGAPDEGWDVLGWRWGTAWHGMTETMWDDDESRRNNHPDHQEHYHWINTDMGAAVGGDVFPAAPGTTTLGMSSKYDCCCDMTLRHGGIFNDWPNDLDWPDDEKHEHADTDNRPPFFVLAFIVRIDNSKEADVPWPTEYEDA